MGVGNGAASNCLQLSTYEADVLSILYVLFMRASYGTVLSICPYYELVVPRTFCPKGARDSYVRPISVKLLPYQRLCSYAAYQHGFLRKQAPELRSVRRPCKRLQLSMSYSYSLSNYLRAVGHKLLLLAGLSYQAAGIL